MVEEDRIRRDTVAAGLNAIPGVHCHRPGGAFYVFPNITDTGIDEHLLADALLAEAGVAILAGTAFGAMGRGFIRLSYATDVATLVKVVGRIRDFLAGEGAARLRRHA